MPEANSSGKESFRRAYKLKGLQMEWKVLEWRLGL